MKSHDRDIADQKESHSSENSLHSALWSSEPLITIGLRILPVKGEQEDGDDEGRKRKREECSSSFSSRHLSWLRFYQWYHFIKWHTKVLTKRSAIRMNDEYEDEEMPTSAKAFAIVASQVSTEINLENDALSEEVAQLEPCFAHLESVEIRITAMSESSQFHRDWVVHRFMALVDCLLSRFPQQKMMQPCLWLNLDPKALLVYLSRSSKLVHSPRRLTL